MYWLGSWSFHIRWICGTSKVEPAGTFTEPTNRSTETNSRYQVVWNAGRKREALSASIPDPPKPGGTKGGWIPAERKIWTFTRIHYLFSWCYSKREKTDTKKYIITDSIPPPALAAQGACLTEPDQVIHQHNNHSESLLHYISCFCLSQRANRYKKITPWWSQRIISTFNIPARLQARVIH